MVDIPNLPPAFSLARLKQLSKILPKIRKLPQEIRETARKQRAIVEKIIPADFSWAYLYELSVIQLNALSLATLGTLDRMERAHKAGEDLNALLMDMIIESDSDEDKVEDWNGGYKGLFKESDVFAVQFATNGMMLCLGIYGRYLNDLVAIVRDGKDRGDEAFFKAVTIDRTVLTCPTFAARLVRAELYGDKHFVRRLHKAVKGKPHDSLLMYQDLRFFLQLFHEAKVLPKLSIEQSDLLFIQELKLYNEAGDPARSLWRFIERWKQQQETSPT